jgi:cytochrome oxidase Cu insertion factor (SCO1/SenC/PrrC family)
MNSPTEVDPTSPQNSNISLPPATGSLLPYALCIAVAFGMAYFGWKWWEIRQFELTRGDAIPASVIGPPLKQFELTERSGSKFSSTEMRGRVWVATYFFTSCPGQCLRLNANLQVLNAMPELKDITWVSISCDPDTDTLEALRAYADRFQADPKRWLFCRGELDYVKRVAKGMGLYLSLKGHQDIAIVIDKTGKIRGVFDATSESQCTRLKDKLLECMAEKAPNDLVTTGKASGKSS